MIKQIHVSPIYELLKAYLDKLDEYQSTGKPPILYPNVNSQLEKKVESEKK